MSGTLIYQSPEGFLLASELQRLVILVSVALVLLFLVLRALRKHLIRELRTFPHMPLLVWARLLTVLLALFGFGLLGPTTIHTYVKGALNNATSVRTGTCTVVSGVIIARPSSSNAAQLFLNNGAAYFIDFARDFYSIRREVLALRKGDNVSICDYRGKIVRLVKEQPQLPTDMRE